MKALIRQIQTSLLLIIFVTSTHQVLGQQLSASLVSTGGESFTTANQSIEFSIGEIAVESYALAGGSISITQGFLQGMQEGTGMKEQTLPESHVHTFPNPAAETITINCKTKPDHIEIMNVFGNLAYTVSNVDSNTSIDVSDMPSGIYFLRLVFSGYKPLTKSIIVQ